MLYSLTFNLLYNLYLSPLFANTSSNFLFNNSLTNLTASILFKAFLKTFTSHRGLQVFINLDKFCSSLRLILNIQRFWITLALLYSMLTSFPSTIVRMMFLWILIFVIFIDSNSWLMWSIPTLSRLKEHSSRSYLLLLDFRTLFLILTLSNWLMEFTNQSTSSSVSLIVMLHPW